jgi:outer membrane protein OmpU
MSPDILGLSFGGMYSFGKVAGDFHHGSGGALAA